MSPILFSSRDQRQILRAPLEAPIFCFLVVVFIFVCVFLVVGFLAHSSVVNEINLPRRIIDGLHSGRRQGSDDFFQVSDVFLFGIFQCDTLRSDILDGLKVLLCLGVFHDGANDDGNGTNGKNFLHVSVSILCKPLKTKGKQSELFLVGLARAWTCACACLCVPVRVPARGFTGGYRCLHCAYSKEQKRKVSEKRVYAHCGDRREHKNTTVQTPVQTLLST